MLSRILSFFRRLFHRLPDESRERDIFAFRYGDRVIHRDPLAVWYELERDPEFSWQQVAAFGELNEHGQAEAAESLTTPICRAFRVVPYTVDDQAGLTIGEQLRLLLEFTLYLDAVKKKLETPPTTSQPSGSSPSAGFTATDEAESPTGFVLDLSQTTSESSSDAPPAT